MVYIVESDLLKSNCDVIGHQSNCKMGFGSGIAGQIRKQLPYAYEVFVADDRTPEQKLGSYSMGMDDSKKPVVFNLYGQLNYGGMPGVVYTDYKALKSSIKEMLSWVDDANGFYDTDLKVGLPYLIGCGLAGGDWNIVYKIIEDLSEEYGIDIYLYKYTPN